MGFFDLFRKKQKIDIKPELKESRTLIIDKQYGTAHWPERNYENFARETYMKNVISFRCIFFIASSLASVRWNLFQQTDTERIEITNHPIYKLLKRANPEESFTFLVQKMVSYLMIAGNTYVEKVSPSTDIPKELYILRPDKIKIDTNKDTGRKERFVYDNKLNFDIDPITGKCDLLQIKTFHPLDDFFGLSITEPTAREIDSSNEASEWQKNMFENEGRPGMAVMVHGFLTDEQWDRLEKNLNEKYSGSQNAGRNLIIEGDAKGDIKPYAWSPKEMDWIESNRELSRRICIGYGIPPMLLGIPGDNTYSNYKEARAAFWEETIIYYLDLITNELNAWLFQNEESLFIDYDLNDVPAMAYKQEIVWTRIKDANFMTIDEKREAVGMEKLPNGVGDVILVGIGQTTLDQLVMTNEEMNNMPNEPDQQIADEEQIADLQKQGYDEEIARQMVGDKW